MHRLMRTVVLLAAFLIAVAAPAAPRDPAWQAQAQLHRGVNVLGYDPLWTDPAKARFKARHFRIIRQGGFDFVRIVLQSFAHMDAQDRLDPKWLATLDVMVREAQAAGLRVIIDEHDFDFCADAPAACEAKLLAFWRQIGARYRDQPDTMLFELLNEPHGALNGEAWNSLLAKVLPVVRATNQTRTVVIGPSHWNSINDLQLLKLPPDDRNILVTFHYYEPFRFTHQGAGWAGDVKDLRGIPFTAADETAIAHDFDKALAWSKANDRPLLLGEFGAYDKSGTPLADRVRYTRTMRRLAEARSIPWAYWQFDSDFVVYNIDRDRWVEPIRRALVDPAAR